MMRALFILLILPLISACSLRDPLSGSQDPHSPWWNLGFTAPYYMLAQVEHSGVIDTSNVLFHLPGGRLAGEEPEWNGVSAKEWAGRGGIGYSVTGAVLPRRIYVRWQSIAEPQTNEVWSDKSWIQARPNAGRSPPRLFEAALSRREHADKSAKNLSLKINEINFVL
ncbi:DUF2931 family protein [Pseudomonas sp. R5(2019)]|uniref:DUF2931 family protein n=1 Tax=Pseudomonas sp. R5(2019) TaxID=2697566 RepID=UPI001411EA7E|nr:DUF2931 family protein [Pseudomonas sp. R5(2019)]NBA93671.1 DUF2931 family protein [Pseudomonas sp. R5(2019)]